MIELIPDLTTSGRLPTADASRPLARTDQPEAINRALLVLASVVVEAVIIIGVVLATIGLGWEDTVGQPDLRSPSARLASGNDPSLPGSVVEP